MRQPRIKVKAVISYENTYTTSDSVISSSALKELQRGTVSFARGWGVLPEYVHNEIDSLYATKKADVAKVVSFEIEEVK